MKLPLLLSLALAPAVLVMPSIATAQNLLTVNASFEATNVNDGFSNFSGAPVTNNTDIPGWSFNLPNNSFEGVASYSAATGLDGSRASYIAGGGSAMTLASARPAITPGVSYLALGFARTDSEAGNISTGTLTLSFYGSDNVTLLGSFPVTADLPAKVSNTDPFLAFSVTGLAPAGAAFAGVTFADVSANGAYQNIDNFQITVPEPSTYVMALGGIGLLLAARRFRGTVRV